MGFVFKKIGIIGVGLLGASFAMAVKRLNTDTRIWGYGRNKDNLKRAKEKGIIDEYAETIEGFATKADLIVFAVPVGSFLDIIQELTPFLQEGAIVSDVGSVKGSLVYTMEKALPQGVSFVGVHPIAGKDKSGLDAADPDLFTGADCIITPTMNTKGDALTAITLLWKSIGCNIMYLTPERHDEVLSSISHMPHVAAFALVNAVSDIEKGYLDFSGTGFRDTTRIAMSSPEVWSDICLLNKGNILKHIDVYIDRLRLVAKYITIGDKKDLIEEFSGARSLRMKLIEKAKKKNMNDNE